MEQRKKIHYLILEIYKLKIKSEVLAIKFYQTKEMNNFKIPVVALTADAVTGAKEKYLSLGFFVYILKPININSLSSVLQMIKNTK